MRLLSIQTGVPREVSWNGRVLRTGYFKESVEGPVFLHFLNLDGDRQADLTNHGGTEKAAYAYPSEHYKAWRAEWPDAGLQWGVFGENFTTEGLLEDEVNIRDCFRIGEAEVRVTQPRIPCPKLGMRFGDPGMVQRFRDRGWPGFYLAVVREGLVQPGDAIERTVRDPNGITVADMHRMIHSEKIDVRLAEHALRAPELSEEWQNFLRHRIAVAQ
jgi:MOSC domain-containing protein YiiM